MIMNFKKRNTVKESAVKSQLGLIRKILILQFTMIPNTVFVMVPRA